MLKNIIITCLILTSAMTSGCTKFSKSKDSSKSKADAPSSKTLNLYIWSEYTSPTVLEAFTKKTGIKVNEANYASNEEMLAKIQSGASGYDIVVPSDYMVSVMKKLELLAEIDKSAVPNIKNLDPKFLGKNFDPENKYSFPYAWGTTGIAVNKALYTEPVTGWDALFTETKASGRIAMLDDVREALGAALKFEGKSLNSKTDAELASAKQILLKAKKHLKAFNSTPADMITSGEVVMAQMYSAEALVAARDSGRLIEFVLPKEGAAMAIDSIAVLKSAKNKPEAWAFINFIFEISSNADLVTRLLTGPVVNGVQDQLPADIKNHKGLFPSELELKAFEMMEDLGDATTQYDRLWSEIKSSSH
jgi:spermidine/putrescine transport system substrate-binding protein